MNLVIIDTATKVARVCVKTDSVCIYNEIDNEITHSEKLLPLIDKTLKEASLYINEIDAIGVTTGPGSFTGIRIGIATVKGLAIKDNLSIYPISNLELMANSFHSLSLPKYLVTMIDSKHDRVYFNIFENTNEMYSPISEAKNLTILDALKNIKEIIHESEIVFLLDNKEYFEQIIKNYFKNDTNVVLLNGNILLQVFSDLIFKGKIKKISHDKLDATYARLSEAERTKNGE